ncbi:MAG: hypothetical protein HYY18_09565 [Planctomycetes bacterium]|nr:hypothetical protein [Planctomycetota bacterium]
MKKLAVVALALAAGCVDKHVLINHWYREDGYMVKGMHGKYDWDEKSGVATLKTGEGFEERTYTDRDRDGLPDEIKFNNEIIHRNTEGTEEVFVRADHDFEQARRRYEIADVEAEWRRMSPDERAERNRYFTK